MTTIKAEFKGNQKDLEMFLSTGVKDYSMKVLTTNTLFISWICDEPDHYKALEDCMDLVDMRKVELWNIEVNYIS